MIDEARVPRRGSGRDECDDQRRDRCGSCPTSRPCSRWRARNPFRIRAYREARAVVGRMAEPVMALEPGQARGGRAASARTSRRRSATSPRPAPPRSTRSCRLKIPAEVVALTELPGMGPKTGEGAVRPARDPEPRRSRDRGARGQAARARRLRRDHREERAQGARGLEPVGRTRCCSPARGRSPSRCSSTCGRRRRSRSPRSRARSAAARRRSAISTCWSAAATRPR